MSYLRRMYIERRPSTAPLPPLAWCARLQRDSTMVELQCGSAVEVRGDARAFFEGAWAGAFSAWDFDRVPGVFGSGGKLDSSGTMFVTPSHTCERVQLLRPDPNTLLVSNSLCFLLAMADDALDPCYVGYARAFSRVVDGIRRFRTVIPTRRKRHVELIYFRNIRVDASLRTCWIDKTPFDAIADFADYERLLTDTVGSVAANAADAQRRAGRYRLLTSVSSGYDSAACAAIAKRNGCTDALTLAEARDASFGVGESDSGAPVAQGIGLAVRTFSRLDYQRNECPEAEFLATGMNGEDVTFLAFETALQNRVFLTGFHGDKVWDRNVAPNHVLKRGDLSGASLGEFRLRTNFVHVPMPFICALQHEQIHRLANAPQLAAWSVGGPYDRPLPRRLAEQAGAPREAFGISKKATTAQMHNHGLAAMSASTRAEVLDFARRLRLPRSARLRFRIDALALRGQLLLYRTLGRARVLRLLPWLKRWLRGYPVHLHTDLGPLPLVWATERIKAERYLPLRDTQPSAGRGTHGVMDACATGIAAVSSSITRT